MDWDYTGEKLNGEEVRMSERREAVAAKQRTELALDRG